MPNKEDIRTELYHKLKLILELILAHEEMVREERSEEVAFRNDCDWLRDVPMIILQEINITPIFIKKKFLLVWVST